MTAPVHAMPAALSLAELTSTYAIQRTPFLSAFLGYCRQAQANTRALEWSYKWLGERVEGSRFLHTALEGHAPEISTALDQLVSRVSQDRPSLAGHQPSLTTVLRDLATWPGAGVAVGYSDVTGRSGEPVRELKLYVATSRVDAVRPVIAGVVPAGAAPPPGLHRVMIAVSLDEDGGATPRSYFLWTRDKFLHRSQRPWFRRWCTAEEQDLMAEAGSATICVSFKGGTRDMVYLSKPAAASSVDALVLRAAASCPLARDRLPTLRWVGFSKGQEGLASDEINLYFPLALG